MRAGIKNLPPSMTRVGAGTNRPIEPGQPAVQDDPGPTPPRGERSAYSSSKDSCQGGLTFPIQVQIDNASGVWQVGIGKELATLNHSFVGVEPTHPPTL